MAEVRINSEPGPHLGERWRSDGWGIKSSRFKVFGRYNTREEAEAAIPGLMAKPGMGDQKLVAYQPWERWPFDTTSEAYEAMLKVLKIEVPTKGVTNG